jgi:hypothetical protein
MENEKIKNPLTNRYIYINGDTYKKLLTKGYTQDYLLSLPRTTVTKPKTNQITNVILNNDMMYEIALNLKYVDIFHLCQTNKNYNHLICQNEHFWELKYNKDYTEFNQKQYQKQADYWKKWFPKDFRTFDEYNEERFEDSNKSWKTLYEDTFYDYIETITLNIFSRFDIRKKYEDDYDERKDQMTRAIIDFMQNGNKNIINDLKKILDYHYKKFNNYYKIFKQKPPDYDTPETFLRKQITNL